MADNTNEKQPLGLQERIMEAGMKTVEKQTKTKVEEGMAQGQHPEEILKQLLQSVTSLSNTPVPTDKRMGMGTSLIKGHGTDRPFYQKPLGASGAIQLMGLQQKMEQDQRGIPKEQAEFAKLLQGIMAGTPEGQRQAQVYKAEGQALAQEKKKAAETGRNVKLAKQSLELTFDTWDKMVKKTEELSGVAAGRRGGVFTKYFGATGQNPYVKAFRGQVAQSVARIAKIAAPSAKVGPELMKVFTATMPTEWDNLAESKNQIVTSMTESFGAYAATHPEDFPDGIDIQTFQQETNAMLDTLVSKQEKAKPKLQDKTNMIDSKIKMANQLSKNNPNLSKQEILNMVNSRIK